MANVKLNPVLEKIHGQIGDLVFKQYQDQTVVARKADGVMQPNSAAQQAVKEKFRLAALYGKAVMTDATQATPYKARSKQERVPVFALMVADFLNAPVVDEIDLSAYAGRTGDPILIRAHDDFEVAGVEVLIRNSGGTVVEQGTATLSSADGAWRYQATTDIAAGAPLVVEVSATDRPGHKGTRTATRG